ncbi:MAG TPA: hypothetical protein PK685_01095 [archaeon]|jgi:flagellar basal body-associated protein FliL|nr:hypothetical protein [archaeon]
MDKKTLIIGGIIILALVIVGIFVFTGSKSTEENTDDTTAINPELQTDLDSLNEDDLILDSNETSEIIEVN